MQCTVSGTISSGLGGGDTVAIIEGIWKTSVGETESSAQNAGRGFIFTTIADRTALAAALLTKGVTLQSGMLDAYILYGSAGTTAIAEFLSAGKALTEGQGVNMTINTPYYKAVRVSEWSNGGGLNVGVWSSDPAPAGFSTVVGGLDGLAGYTLISTVTSSTDYAHSGSNSLFIPPNTIDPITQECMAYKVFTAPASGTFVVSSWFYVETYTSTSGYEVSLGTVKSGTFENAGGAFHSYCAFIRDGSEYGIKYYHGGWTTAVLKSAGPYGSGIAEGHWYQVRVTLSIGSNVAYEIYDDVGAQIAVFNGTMLTPITAGLQLYHTVLRRGGSADAALYIDDLVTP